MKKIVFLWASLLSIYAYADYQSIGQMGDDDRLEQLSKTLYQGSYVHSHDMDLPPVSNVSVKLKEKTIELNDKEIVSQRLPNKSRSHKNYSKPREQYILTTGCSCSTGNYCYGPRGGRFCYTSGGNKAYR